MPDPAILPEPDHETVLQRQLAFGYTFEDLRILMLPMARDGAEAVGSMGTDTPLAVLSNKPQPLFNYFKQLFAQVTNPPIDCIREEIITSTETAIGSERNLLKPSPEHARLIELKSPILTNEEFAKLKHIDLPGFKSVTFPILFKVADGAPGLEKAMDELCRQVSQAIQDGINVVVLSDRGVNKEWAPIPSLLAVAGVHHHLIREGTRTRVGLVLESGEPREVHHFSLLIGYGCGAINPYLAFETLDDMIRQGLLTGMDHKTACKNYLKAAMKGVVKVISKMGISTIQSYWGAQIFEAVGLKQSFIDKYFTGHALPHRRRRHRGHRPGSAAPAPAGVPGPAGQRPRAGRRRPVPVARGRRVSPVQSADHPQAAGRGAHRQLQGVQGVFRAGQRAEPELVHAARLARLQEGQARSHRGSRVGREHHEALQVRRHELRLDQPGSARDAGHRHEPHRRQEQHRRRRRRPRALRCRCPTATRRTAPSSRSPPAASASPANTWSTPRSCRSRWPRAPSRAKAASCPGQKVYPWIAKVRYSTPGVGLISPPPHHDIYSIEDLAELIHDLKNANHHARISVKLVSEVGVGTVAAGRRQGARGRGADQRLRRRHGRFAADRHQARGHPVGAGPGRDAPDAGAQ